MQEAGVKQTKNAQEQDREIGKAGEEGSDLPNVLGGTKPSMFRVPSFFLSNNNCRIAPSCSEKWYRINVRMHFPTAIVSVAASVALG
jgi:hypothetical protein